MRAASKGRQACYSRASTSHPLLLPSPSLFKYVEKPGDYKTEHAFMHDIYTRAMSCTRHYYNIW